MNEDDTPLLHTPSPITLEIPGIVLETEIGRGGMGVVFRGRQVALERPVAVKILDTALHRDAAFLGRFQREAKLLARLLHPHIVACFEAGTTPRGEHYLVMEFVEGGDLASRVKATGPLSVRDAVVVALQTAEALGHAFEFDIIHRDVKPENILLQPVPPKRAATSIGAQAKLVDLGLARLAEAEPKAESGGKPITSIGAILGTPHTMAPEQVGGLVDHRADIYALGTVLYFALVGRYPFVGKTGSEVLMKKNEDPVPFATDSNPEIPAALSETIRRLMAKNRDERPATYDEVLDLLQAHLDALPVAGSRASGHSTLRYDPPAGGSELIEAGDSSASTSASDSAAKKADESDAGEPWRTLAMGQQVRAKSRTGRDYELTIVRVVSRKTGLFVRLGDGTLARVFPDKIDWSTAEGAGFGEPVRVGDRVAHAGDDGSLLKSKVLGVLEDRLQVVPLAARPRSVPPAEIPLEGAKLLLRTTSPLPGDEFVVKSRSGRDYHGTVKSRTSEVFKVELAPGGEAVQLYKEKLDMSTFAVLVPLA